MEFNLLGAELEGGGGCLRDSRLREREERERPFERKCKGGAQPPRLSRWSEEDRGS